MKGKKNLFQGNDIKNLIHRASRVDNHIPMSPENKLDPLDTSVLAYCVVCYVDQRIPTEPFFSTVSRSLSDIRNVYSQCIETTLCKGTIILHPLHKLFYSLSARHLTLFLIQDESSRLIITLFISDFSTLILSLII